MIAAARGVSDATVAAVDSGVPRALMDRVCWGVLTSRLVIGAVAADH